MAQWGCKIKRYSARRAGGKGVLTEVGLASPFKAICVSLAPINALMFSRLPSSGTLSQNTGEPRHVRRHN
jgi:hypothetical protein